MALHESLEVLTQFIFAERVTGAFTRRAVLALGLHLGIGAKRHINLDGLVIAHHGKRDRIADAMLARCDDETVGRGNLRIVDRGNDITLSPASSAGLSAFTEFTYAPSLTARLFWRAEYAFTVVTVTPMYGCAGVSPSMIC